MLLGLYTDIFFHFMIHCKGKTREKQDPDPGADGQNHRAPDRRNQARDAEGTVGEDEGKANTDQQG